MIPWLRATHCLDLPLAPVWARRALMENMETSLWLPNEVLFYIMQHTPKADQAVLSRVSKLFHTLCLPVLNRDVKIKGSRSISLFCSGIVQNPSRANAVRSFILARWAAESPYSSALVTHRPDRPYENRVKIRNNLILASLQLMLRLNHLSISPFVLDESRHCRSLVEKPNFPRLISCNIWVPDGLLVEVFLAQHSNLKRIYLHSRHCMVPSESVRISLPNLEYYEGDAVFILTVDAVRLKEVQLTWHSADDGDVDEITITLSSIIRKTRLC
ncbi:hypothetical protein C8R45DRAFT_921476 [Mycena sanguinolenta]|nr:hypothetical protein C8R45DRAFT_921476 [Mycena sanguinolenta]